MFTLAHLSDWHLASRPALSELIGKRGLGYINWHRARKKIHRPEILDATIRDLKASAPDHIAVTGDLVNLSLPDEYNRARGWLQTLGSPRDVTLVPGNHDIYVGRVRQSPAKFWADYMRGDDGLDRFPFVRRRRRRRCWRPAGSASSSWRGCWKSSIRHAVRSASCSSIIRR
jgi:3',5'-cyclic AMP phosphodiesterase CpdA